MKKSSRRRALEEWRGLPDSEPRPDRTVLVRDVLAQLAPKLGLENRLGEEEILAVWGELVGPFFAEHSRPTKLLQGVLLVQVLQPTVLYELDRQWKSVVLQKLKARFGGRLIKDVRFRLG
jgi:predicted nucleic acid-binding Zn ribbon protein